MIAVITTGHNFGGVIAYAERGLRDKGHDDERDDISPITEPDKTPDDAIGGAVGYAATNPNSPTRDSILLDHNLAGGRYRGETPQAIAAEMDAVRRTRPGIKDPVMHVSIRWPRPDSNRMTTPDLRQYGREFIDRFGVDTTRNQYVMYTHNSAAGDPHLHIVLNRVPVGAREHDAIGRNKRTSTIKMWQSTRRCMSICRAMERAHPHAMTPVVEEQGWPVIFRPRPYERQQEETTGQDCRRREVFNAVTRAAKDPRAVDLGSFIRVLGSIDPNLTVATWEDKATGTVRGIKIVDAATMVGKEKVMQKAKKKGKKVEQQKDIEKDTPKPKQWHSRNVHKQLTFKRLGEQLEVNKAKRQRVADVSRTAAAMKEMSEYYDQAREQGRAAVEMERAQQPGSQLQGARLAGARTDQRLDRLKEERDAPAPSPGINR